MWNAAIGKKEYAYYHVLKFSEMNYLFESKPQEDQKYGADFGFYTGELLSLADSVYPYGYRDAEFKKVVYEETKFMFFSKDLAYSGDMEPNGNIYLTVNHRIEGEKLAAIFRYIPLQH
jgi:hypothetical protein